ncbi:glycosyltransferase [Streptomyces sp. NPDC055025]
MNYFAELGELLNAEYRAEAGGTRHIVGTAPDPRDADAGDLAYLRALQRTRKTAPVDELLNYVGRSARMDLLVTMALAQHGDALAPQLRAALRPRMTEAGPASDLTAALLNLATDCDVTPFPLPAVVSLVRKDGNGAVTKAALRHLLLFPQGVHDTLFLGLPESLIDFEDILTWMIAAHARGHDRETIERHLPEDRREIVRLLPEAVRRHGPGATVMQQFAMWGPLDRPGEGDSGGLAVFLSSLGDALAQQDGVGRVVTVVQIGSGDLARARGWTRDLGSGHMVLGIPVAPEGAATAHADEPLSEIGWWLRTLLPALGLVPDVAHLRFGSDVTLTVARTVRKLGSRTVFGIAPDPHRMILDSHHTDTGGFDRDGFGEDLHRMFAADVLSGWADSAVALPNAWQRQETTRFFPQVVSRLKTVEAIPEGITPWREQKDDDADGRRLIGALFERNGFSGLSEDSGGLPVLLNVGRWNPLKQQDTLVDAWIRSGLCESSALVLVGGSLEHPTAVESVMRERVAELLRATPAAHGRFVWLPRLPNRDVRLLERALVSHLPASGPHVYLCGSAKEEFGISVLEAMEAGLLAVAPRRGGASHYIQPGVTGFLADTSSLWGLTADMSLILGGGQPADRLRSIAEAGKRVVSEEFVISHSARRFARHYLRLVNR